MFFISSIDKQMLNKLVNALQANCRLKLLLLQFYYSNSEYFFKNSQPYQKSYKLLVIIIVYSGIFKCKYLSNFRRFHYPIITLAQGNILFSYSLIIYVLEDSTYSHSYINSSHIIWQLQGCQIESADGPPKRGNSKYP